MDSISGVTAFISIADALQKLYETLKSYIKALTVAAAEAKRLAKEISDFASLLLLVESTLSDLQGVMWRSTEFTRVERSQIASAKELIYRLKRLNKNFPQLLERGQGSFFRKWLMRHRWTAIRQDIQVLQYSVETSKGSLAILLHVVQLEYYKELLQRLFSTNATGEKVAKLKAKIVQYKKQLRIEQEETARVQAEYLEYIKNELARRPVSQSPTTTAAQEAIKFATNRLHSTSPRSSSESHSSRPHHSPSPPPSQLSVPSIENSHTERVTERLHSPSVVEISDRPSTDDEAAPSTLPLRPDTPNSADFQPGAPELDGPRARDRVSPGPPVPPPLMFSDDVVEKYRLERAMGETHDDDDLSVDENTAHPSTFDR